jgi:hypothetical protein
MRFPLIALLRAMTRSEIITYIVVAAGVGLSVFFSIRHFGWPIALLAGPILYQSAD